jgi:hypothetical protein
MAVKKSTSVSSLRQDQDNQIGGMINRFKKFSEEELAMMESNEDYYMPKEQVKKLFRRYMIKKRLISKDDSYENFMLRNSKRYSNHEFDQFSR